MKREKRRRWRRIAVILEPFHQVNTGHGQECWNSLAESSTRLIDALLFFLFLSFYFNPFSLISRFSLFFFLILILFCLQKTPINNERHGEPDRKGGWVVIIPKQQELIVESQSTPGYILNTGWINQNPETI